MHTATFTPFVSLHSFFITTLITLLTLIPSVFAGNATFYRPAGGTGACGATLQNSDYIAALGYQDYGDGSNCWKHITISHYGNTVDVMIADKCESCQPGNLDLSEAAFKKLADLSEGIIEVDWHYSG